MIDETLDELKSAIGKAHESLKRELSRLRTGRANPGMLESLRVDYYGQPTPITQMANVSVPEARMLVIKPWDKAGLRLIESTIREAGLGLNPQVDGEIIRIPMPPLTEDRRKELTKIARKSGEESKVAIRKARHDAKDMLAGLENEGEAAADDVERAMKKVEEVVQAGVTTVDEIVARKEKDIMEV